MMKVSDFVYRVSKLSSVEELDKFFFEEYVPSTKKDLYSQAELDLIALSCALLSAKKRELKSTACK